MNIIEFFQGMGFMQMTWQQAIMLLVSFFLLYLAIHKKYEPLLLLPIAFGMLLTNLPGAGMFHSELWSAFLDPESPAYHSYGAILKEGGLLDVLYIGVKAGVHRCRCHDRLWTAHRESEVPHPRCCCTDRYLRYFPLCERDGIHPC